MKKKQNYTLAVIGVGAVGVEILRCLKERSFPVGALRVFARSARDIKVDGHTYHVEAIEGAEYDGIDIALFAGTEGEKGASATYADQFIKQGAVVIDNGADFRLKKDVPLVVPEANREAIFYHKGLIANPNCTTIQAIVALASIHKQLGLNRILLTSFQATSGAGRAALDALWQETKQIIQDNADKGCCEVNKKLNQAFDTLGYQIAFNVIPKIGSFNEEGFTSEECKVVQETHKIFNDNSIKISATCARVPVFTSHSEAIYFETKKDTDCAALLALLERAPGVVLHKGNEFSLPLHVEGTDCVYVSRIRRDASGKNCFWMWVVADNLRKGAALNAVQIAEELIKAS